MTQRERYLEEIRDEVKRSIAKAKSGELPMPDTGALGIFDFVPEIVRPAAQQVLIVSKVKIGNGWIN